MLYTAIIIEPRKHKALSFVLDNFLSNLSNDWSIIVFHSNNNIDYLNDIINNNLSHFKSRLSLINLNIDNLTVDEYSDLLKYNKDLYNHIPTEIFLVFQTDTIIFEMNKSLINHFLKYDYVGAPWQHPHNNHQLVGNGGLSLRRKSKMIEIMEKQGKNDFPEDIYFSCFTDVNLYKPSFEKAKLFSVETVYSSISFGCHKPWCRDFENKLYDKYYELKELYKYNDIII